MTNSLMKCENLNVWYRNEEEAVLNNLSLNIPSECSFILFYGPNGCGKTTLFRVIRGLHKSFGMKVEGNVLVGGINPLECPAFSLGESIGIVFQRPSAQLFNLTVSEEVRSGPLFLGFKWEEVLKREVYGLKSVGINNLKDKVTFWLSGGEQQKVIIAAILAMKPSIILLDEPTSYLDPVSRKDFLKTLKKLSASGVKILMISHRIAEELSYADYLVFLEEGKVTFEGGPESIAFKKFYERNIVFKEKGNLLPNNSLKTEPIIAFKNVSVKYPSGAQALKNVSISIPKNKITCVLGPNGSGKTTIVKSCTKLVKHSGSIKILGREIRKIRKSELPKLVGYVTQDPAEMLFSDTAFDEVLFGVKNLDMDEPKERAENALKKIGIYNLRDKPPETLSMGQQRLLSIAVMLAMNPKVLFLDEPELALDLSFLSKTIEIFRNLKKEVTFVILTHDLDTFLPICEHAIILKEGGVIAQGNPRNILNEEIAKEANLK